LRGHAVKGAGWAPRPSPCSYPAWTHKRSPSGRPTSSASATPTGRPSSWISRRRTIRPQARRARQDAEKARSQTGQHHRQDRSCGRRHPPTSGPVAQRWHQVDRLVRPGDPPQGSFAQRRVDARLSAPAHREQLRADSRAPARPPLSCAAHPSARTPPVLTSSPPAATASKCAASSKGPPRPSRSGHLGRQVGLIANGY
jgi:hypothetical protein